MPLQSHGLRFLLALFSIFVLLLLLLELGFGVVVERILNRTTTRAILNDTLGFESIFVVNAPWRTDRKDAISLAALYSKLKIDWVYGVAADVMQEKAYPPGNHRTMSPGNLGSWRAHMDAMREIIVRNLTTALILEDDVDWDIRIRTQLLSFSYAARTLPSITNSSYDQPPSSETRLQNPIDLAKRCSLTIPLKIAPAASTPYGLDWDVLWLGHCGTDLPVPCLTRPNRLMLLNDVTVPTPKHLKLRDSSPPDTMAGIYPPHTRIYHRTSNSTLCTLAYAVTQRGARKILYELGIRDMSKGFDFALGDYCGGMVKNDDGEYGVERRLECLTVQPPLFSHFWPERGRSDIVGVGIGGRPEVGSRYIMRSVRGNLEGLGEGGTLFEQWTD